MNISVNVTASKNAGQFIGGTSPSFMIKGVVDKANSCPSLVTTYSTEIPNSTETPLTICPVLDYANDRDAFNVPAKVVVPSDVPSGAKTSTITFSATKV